MALKTQVINNVRVTPPPEAKVEKLKVIGEEVCKNPYANIGLIARKQSGKSTTLIFMIKECLAPGTKLFLFASTIGWDPAYISFLKWLDKNGYDYTAQTSIFSDNGKVNILDKIVDAILDKPKETKSDKEVGLAKSNRGADIAGSILLAGMRGPKQSTLELKKSVPRAKKPKYRANKYIFVFDDLSNELRSPSIGRLLRINRQFHSKCFLSSQSSVDIQPSAKKQIFVWCLWKAISPDKLEEIHRDASIWIDLKQFVKIYHDATKEPYSFLYIDTENLEFRKCFSAKYLLPTASPTPLV